MRMSRINLRHAMILALGFLFALSLLPEQAEGQRRGGGGRGGGGRGGGGRGGARPPAARANVNRDFSRAAARPSRPAERRVDRDVQRNVSRDINADRDWNLDVDVDDDWYPVGRTAAAVTAAAVTAAAIGSVAYSIPSGCATRVIDGVTYQECNGTWYEPQFSGSTVTYVVVSPP